MTSFFFDLQKNGYNPFNKHCRFKSRQIFKGKTKSHKNKKVMLRIAANAIFYPSGEVRLY